jgi:uncharacterized protein with HEPN domain
MVMLECVLKLGRFLKRKNIHHLKTNELLLSGVLRELEVFGEASTHVSERARRYAPSVIWKKIRGLRNILAHEYYDIDVTSIWLTATKSIPAMKKALEKMLGELLPTQ